MIEARSAPTGLHHLLTAGARQLVGAGIEHAEREAWWIWERISGQNPLDRLIDHAELDAAKVRRFTLCIERRCGGEPLAYVLDEAAFRSLILTADARALIPRPETEGLVDLVLQRQRTGVVVDVGTGTGCIALSLAAEGEYRLVLAIDMSPAALALARLNFQLLQSRAVLIHGDLSTTLGEGSVDVLVSNPPYLTDDEYEQLAPSVRAWEPELALRSGCDGLEATRRLLKDGLRVVKAGGWLILEVDCSRAAMVAADAADHGWTDVLVEDDLFGRARYLVARRS